MAVFLQEKIILVLFNFIFLKNLELVVSQYSIKDSTPESFLGANFTGTSDHIFPKNLEIIVYLSRTKGLLFYSIDKKLNQLIVNLQDTKSPTLKVEFRNEKYILSLIDLCKCKLNSCLYEKLALKFQIINSINIQCNGGQINKHSFTNNKLPNEDYPIPSFHKTEITAFLWLINTPLYQNRDKTAYPNAEYLTGCILNVTYDDAPVQLNGPFEKCVNQCEQQTCNDGECIETYNSNPICNCTGAFLNGDHCNKALTRPGQYNFDFEFKILKISLKLQPNCRKPEILRLSSSRTGDIATYLSRSNELIVAYNYSSQSEADTNPMPIEHNITISKIRKDENYILLLELADKSIIIKMKHNNSWNESSLNFLKIVSGTEFQKIRCNLSDVAYKLSKNEIGWLPVKLERNLRNQISAAQKYSNNIGIDDPVLPEKTSCIDENDDPVLPEDTSRIYYLIYILIPIIIVSYGLLFIYFGRRKLQEFFQIISNS